MNRSPILKWPTLISASRARLSSAIPEIGDIEHPVTELLISVVALSECRFTVALTPHSVEAKVGVKPLPKDPISAELRDSIVAFVTARISRNAWDRHIPVARRVEDAGFLSFIITLLKAGVRKSAIMNMARIVSGAMKELHATVRSLGDAHEQAVLSRDLPSVCRDWQSVNHTLVWLLATHLPGDPGRPEIIKRRLQALQLFASVAHILMEDPVTAVIDSGAPLIPILANRLGLSEPELRSLRGALAGDRIYSGFHPDFEAAVRELKAHSVQLHEWPGKGRPDQPAAWQNTPWLVSRHPRLLRPDYFDPDNNEVEDAVRGFREDILCPVVASRAAILFPQPPRRVHDFERELRFDPSTILASEERRDFLAALKRALVGTRGPKAFGEAVGLWHRRAASVAAMRHEHRADRPGWPPICRPWQCPDGLHSIVPLTSAADLVEEGNALDHCVGGYYDTCRRGDTQILSLRRNDAHAATIELRLSGGDTVLSIQVGQFKSRRNSRPDAASVATLKTFLAAINRGEHKIDRRDLIAHRREMRSTYDGWSSKSLTLDHARAVFPLYRPLLPRGAPESFDVWYAESGLAPVIDRVLTRLACADTAAWCDDIPL